MCTLAVNAPTYEEGKVVQGREMDASYGGLRDISGFSNSYTGDKVSDRRLRRIINTTSIGYLANPIEILQTHSIGFIVQIKQYG